MSTTQTIEYSGGWKKFVVPAGRTQVHINASGGGAGARHGGRVAGTLPCNPGDVLWIQVGGQGRLNGQAYGGGGRGSSGTGSGDPGRGGGGATTVRLGSKDGTIVLVAGGAGGDSGDGGHGGAGGADSGEDGSPGSAGTGRTFNAKGGTQKNPGNGGSSGGGKSYAGDDAEPGVLGRGGAGAQVGKANSHGGGGGGGGLRAGGGGQASAIQDNPGGAATVRFPGGGGGGGSNYANARLRGVSDSRGTGGVGNGEVILTFADHGYVQKAPAIPGDVTINGENESSEMATKSMGTIVLKASLFDTNIGQKVQLVAVMVEGPQPVMGATFKSPLMELGRNDDGQNAERVTATITLNGLPLNTLYKMHLWAVDETGQASTGPYGDPTTGFTSISFWTNRPPDPPELLDPDENSQIPTDTDITFAWNYSDPDGGNTQGGYSLRYRRAATPLSAAGPWVYRSQWWDASQSRIVLAEEFQDNTQCEWTVATKDPEGVFGPYAIPRSFYILADSTPPLLTYPTAGQAVDVGRPITFTWTFRDPQPGTSQVDADIRYRVVGTDDWITLFGAPEPAVPGGAGMWTVGVDELAASQHYEWSARTTSTTTQTSGWAEPEDFWTIRTPGSAIQPGAPLTGRMQGPLGYGNNRAFIYRRGGSVYVGELKGIKQLSWDRRRDDTSQINVVIDEFDDLTAQLLNTISTWAYEIVIFRTGPNGTERVAEGPITLIDDRYNEFEIQAKDVSAYLSRRVMRQGYTDGYQLINGVQVGLRTVVDRAELNILNALAYDDPNVIPYLTAIKNDADARQSRIVPDHSRMVLEDIDDLASKAGLDYTVAGRRIILWDTHRMIGRLPEMGNAAFLAPPHITEYGMQLCNYYAVTDGSGVYGSASRGLDSNGQPEFYGWVEMLASAYGTDPDEVSDASLLTSEARAALEATFATQAERNIAHRWPTPKQVKVPENTRLSPALNIGINQLIPGVWVPVRAKSRIMEVGQWQKIDRVSVTQTSKGEQITISMAPAPNNGADPDADAEVETE
jgi:hypothetical protein